MEWSLFVTKTVLRFIPIVYLILGIYLVKNGSIIHNIAYPLVQDNEINTGDEDAVPQEEGDVLPMTAKIALAFKFAGLYLIITTFPNLLNTSSFILTQLHTSKVYSMPSQVWFEKVTTYSQFLPSLGGMLLGIYLLKADNYFIRLALKGPNKPEVNDESYSSSSD
jgi:hypothetical protein